MAVSLTEAETNTLDHGKNHADHALKLAEALAAKALADGMLRSVEDKAEFVRLVRNGLANAVERGQKIRVPSPQEHTQQAQPSGSSAGHDPEITRTPPAKGRAR